MRACRVLCDSVSYRWRDMNGTLHANHDEVLAKWDHYDDLNPVGPVVRYGEARVARFG